MVGCGGLWWAKAVNWVAGLESVVQNEERLPISKQKKKKVCRIVTGPSQIMTTFLFVTDFPSQISNLPSQIFIYSRAFVIRHKSV